MRLRAVRADVPLRDVARLLSSTQISLVVICDQQGVMVGVVRKSDIVRRMGHYMGRTCTDTADVIMTRQVTSCRATVLPRQPDSICL
ncbi:CBS domain-containing protein [Variovorax sp. LG9.2]|uniref:CBS domain-containing protein n=1 Tax=Variovorax sp. LG9.2 TaxID=3048626 RepID=UPI003A598671